MRIFHFWEPHSVGDDKQRHSSFLQAIPQDSPGTAPPWTVPYRIHDSQAALGARPCSSISRHSLTQPAELTFVFLCLSLEFSSTV